MNQNSIETKYPALVNFSERDRLMAETYLRRGEFITEVVANTIGRVRKTAQSLVHVFSQYRDRWAH